MAAAQVVLVVEAPSRRNICPTRMPPRATHGGGGPACMGNPEFFMRHAPGWSPSTGGSTAPGGRSAF
ncbi:MAG: hypothetical protein K6T75_03160 [Acetobacteraceae bacterium]|nr:hypothetical protein [Acetobacteraceae bacterium]